MPQQKGAEAEVLFEAHSSEGGAAPESTTPLKTKAVPETVSAKGSGSITPEEMLNVGLPEVTAEEANIKTQPEAGLERLGVKGLPTGEGGAAGKLHPGPECLGMFCMRKMMT